MTRVFRNRYESALMRIGLPLRWLLATVLGAAVLALAACGGDDAGGDPQTLLGEAAAKPIPNAEIDLRVDADMPGFPILGSKLAITAKGPWTASGPGGQPAFDWRAVLRAGGQTFPARISSVEGGLYVDFMGRFYEAGDDLAEHFAFADVEPGKEGASLAQLGLDPEQWLKRVKVEDGDDIGGDSTKLITGTVVKPAVIEDLLGLVDRDQLDDVEGLPELSDENVDKAADAVRSARVEVNVDDDGYPRRVFADLRFVVPKGLEQEVAIERGDIEFELLLDAIGDTTVDVEPPFDPDPLSSLLDFAGVIFGIEEISDIWRPIE